MTLEPGPLRLHLSHLSTQDVSSHKFRTRAPIFTSRASFSQEAWDDFKKIIKSGKMSWPWDLGPRDYIWATWAQKTYPAISLEPWLQFSQARPHFFKDHKMNPIKSWNLKKCIDLVTQGLETKFGPLGIKRLMKL